uniref:MAGI family member, X-linked b n=1 Tax=Myripristis murdjan TaxID=586833 RepID=A0A667ZSE2_9TELE
MSKTAVKKLHWRSKVQESFVPLLGSSGDLGVAIGGGADYGEFPFVTSAPGGGLTVGDVILEIGGTPVLGMTLGDVRGVLNSCPHPIRIKTVSPGSTLCKDLRLYLSKCFTPGSMDSQLQQVIRENLYLRAVPCTTRQPRDGEISGVDYNFVSVEEFFSLEESGALLESGKFKGEGSAEVMAPASYLNQHWCPSTDNHNAVHTLFIISYDKYMNRFKIDTKC